MFVVQCTLEEQSYLQWKNWTKLGKGEKNKKIEYHVWNRVLSVDMQCKRQTYTIKQHQCWKWKGEDPCEDKLGKQKKNYVWNQAPKMNVHV
jgi:hypothetical protein